MKYYVFSIVGSQINDLSYCFFQMPITITCNEQELKKGFKELRSYLNKEYKNTLKGTLRSYANYKYGICITIIDTKKDKCKHKNFYINPLNLR